MATATPPTLRDIDERRIRDQVLSVYLDEAIRRRVRDRRWYRARDGRLFWADLERDNDTRLRELLRIRREARAIANPIVEREDAITRSKAAALAAGDHYAGMPQRHQPATGAPPMRPGQVYEGIS